MKKSNVIVYILLAVVSIFLLWLWYYLGLNNIDEPLDLVISIVWWLIVIVAIVVIVRVEKARKQRIQTIYVTDDMLFNPELGSINYTTLFELMDESENMLKDLKYNFKKEDMPNANAYPVKAILKTSKYKDDETWEGKVVTVEFKQEREFSNKEELFTILNESGMFDDLEGSSTEGTAPAAQTVQA